MSSSPGGTASRRQAASAERPKPATGLCDGWWPIALSGEVRQHPRAFRLGSRGLAVYRDLGGVVRAVDDSCPHRRLPLSMGRITEDGYLQCAYHGWCFDGATGSCTAIPNLHADEKVPGAARVDAFTTAETIADVLGFGLRTSRLAPAVGPPTGEEPQDGGTTMFEALLTDGLVLVWTGQDEPPHETRPEGHVAPRGNMSSGRATIRAPHDRVAEALLHNPGKMLGLGPLLGSGDELASPEISSDGHTITARRARLRFDLPRAHTFDPVIEATALSEITMVADTGLAWLTAPAADRLPEIQAIVGLTPIGPYRTIVRWTLSAPGAAGAAARALGGLLRVTGRIVTGAEGLADEMERVADPAVERLRDLRASRAERALVPNPHEQEDA